MKKTNGERKQKEDKEELFSQMNEKVMSFMNKAFPQGQLF